MDKEFAEVLYRALMMICRWLEKKFGFGKREATCRCGQYIPIYNTDEDHPHCACCGGLPAMD